MNQIKSNPNKVTNDYWNSTGNLSNILIGLHDLLNSRLYPGDNSIYGYDQPLTYELI